MSTSSRHPSLQSHRVKLEGEISLQISSQDATTLSSAEPNTKKETEMCVGIMGNATGNTFDTVPVTTPDARRESPTQAKFDLQLERFPSLQPGTNHSPISAQEQALQLERFPSLQPGTNHSPIRAQEQALPATLLNENIKHEPNIHLATVGDANGHSGAPVPVASKNSGAETKTHTKDEPVIERPPPAQPDNYSTLAIANPLQAHSMPTAPARPEAIESSQETAMGVSQLPFIKAEIPPMPAQESEFSHFLQGPSAKESSAEIAYQIRNRNNVSLQNSIARDRASPKVERHSNNDADLSYQPSIKDEQASSASMELSEPPVYFFQGYEDNDDQPVQSVVQKVEESRESPVGRVERDINPTRLRDSVERPHIEGSKKSKRRMPGTNGQYRRSERKRSRTSSRLEQPSSQIVLRSSSVENVHPVNDLMQAVHPSDIMEDIERQTAPKPLQQNTRVLQFAKLAERLLSTLCTYAKTSGIDSPKELKKRDYSILAKDAFVLYQSVRTAPVGYHGAHAVGARSQRGPVDDVTREDVVKDNDILPALNPKKKSGRLRQGAMLPGQVVNVVESFVTAMCEFSKKTDGRPRKKLKSQDFTNFVQQAVTVSLSIRGVQLENGGNAHVEKPDDREELMEVSKPERPRNRREDRTEGRPREAVGSSSNSADDDVKHVKRIVARMNDIAKANEQDALQEMWKVSEPLKKMIDMLSRDDSPTYFSQANMVQLFLHFGHAAACIQFLVDQADRSVNGGLLKPPVTLQRVVEWGYEVTFRLEEYFDKCWKRRSDDLERIKLRDTMLRFRADCRDVKTAGAKSVTQSMKQLHIIAGEAKKINLGYQNIWGQMFSDTRRIRARMLTMCNRAYEDLYGNRRQP